MKYLVFLILLPCILAAEVRKAVCRDGTQCSQGKYCCDSGCCDIPKELQDLGYIPALPPSVALNLTVSMAKSKAMADFCFGTQCGSHCVLNIFGGTCCSNERHACPILTQCCSNSITEEPWCCLTLERCGSKKDLCIDGAITASAAMMSVLFACMIGIASKYFL